MQMLAKARTVATTAHEGQTRRDGKTPYITHPYAVAELVEGDDAKAVAMLHDVVEDTSVTLAELEKEFPERITKAVDAMSHRDGEGYCKYVLRLRHNDLARQVKIADITHNMSTLEDNKKTITRIRRERYNLAMHVLRGEDLDLDADEDDRYNQAFRIMNSAVDSAAEAARQLGVVEGTISEWFHDLVREV